MTSFNHYALGAVADWMHRTVAGLAPAEPGYRKSPSGLGPAGGWRGPLPGTRPYGEAVVRWELDGDVFLLSVSVPAGCTAAVYLPDGGTTGVEVGSGTHSFSCAFLNRNRGRPASRCFSHEPGRWSWPALHQW